MRVGGDEAVRVAHQHEVAVALELVARVGDDAVLGRLDRRAFRHRDVDAVVLTAARTSGRSPWMTRPFTGQRKLGSRRRSCRSGSARAADRPRAPRCSRSASRSGPFSAARVAAARLHLRHLRRGRLLRRPAAAPQVLVASRQRAAPAGGGSRLLCRHRETRRTALPRNDDAVADLQLMIEADIVGLGDRHRRQLIVARRANRSSRRAQRHARCCPRAPAPARRRGLRAAASEARAICGAAIGCCTRGITSRWPGWMCDAGGMLLACRIACGGTPWRRAIESMVSPCATMMAVPPSQLQFCGGGAGWRGCDELWIEPVTSCARRRLVGADAARCRRKSEPEAPRSRPCATARLARARACTEPVMSLLACGLPAQGPVKPGKIAAAAGKARRKGRHQGKARHGARTQRLDEATTWEHSLIRNTDE